jgi:hypothetical protein
VKTLYYKNYVHFRRIKRNKKLFIGAGTQKPRSLSSNKIIHKSINNHRIDNNSFQHSFVTLFGLHHEFAFYIQGYSRVIMSPTELKMQPAIHFRKKLDISIASFFRKCSVGCIFNSVGLIITRELPCRSSTVSHKF